MRNFVSFSLLVASVPEGPVGVVRLGPEAATQVVGPRIRDADAAHEQEGSGQRPRQRASLRAHVDAPH